MRNETTMEQTKTALLRDRCLALADELADFGIDRVDDRDLELAFEGLTEANLYATAEAIAYLGDWFN
jgi:hypothetical protein